VQAQSTDIQPEDPAHAILSTPSPMQELSGREMEQLGRLNTPIYRTQRHAL
jgi:hypothetical protein